ncbi:MAG: glutamine--fructose-6-phosphate transaminase (isomerizing), partial [Chlamydiota bacterium]|nr:glutamine--fructose-6-phosphate transaminase (isomerizing) [Chlamydiota bacterium]
MCGIVGHLFRDPSFAITSCFESLEHLTYRGYDSAGIATLHNGELLLYKAAGPVGSLLPLLPSLTTSVAIGHTRWATHGAPTVENAHPHVSQDRSLAIVHNGIIENALQIREKMEAGGTSFRSETDTEILVHMISEYPGPIEEAISHIMRETRGSMAFVCLSLDFPRTLWSFARNSPLIVGRDSDAKRVSIASDPLAIAHHEMRLYVQPNDSWARLTPDSYECFGMGGKRLLLSQASIQVGERAKRQKEYSHFMEQEIFDQIETLPKVNQLLVPSGISPSFDAITLLGCGSSWHAALHGKLIMNQLTSLPVHAEIASEWRYAYPHSLDRHLVVACSQSGETADTLLAAKEAKARGAQLLALSNVAHSSLARIADHLFITPCGPEVSVCATKTFTAQCLALSRLAYRLFGESEITSPLLKESIGITLSFSAQLADLAANYRDVDALFFLGRQLLYPAAREAALKVKEVSALYAEGYPSGEMKHGPLALITQKTLVVGLLDAHPISVKTDNNLMEAEARGASLLRIGTGIDHDITLPQVHPFLQP